MRNLQKSYLGEQRGHREGIRLININGNTNYFPG